ncbi:MAG: hypothetical protein V7719_13715 [Psychroserpens sp.]|uniref:hypothetical protein n=1 Tax=Psychroserpens sp. TaxID=2020870 RepID=UPI003002E504
MKKNFKRFPKLLILFLVICFSGCQKDDVIEPSKVPILNELSVFKIEKSINPDIIKNKGLSAKLVTLTSNINSNDSVLNRSVSFSEYGFTVDTEVANYIEFGNYHSYTFPLERDIDNGLMENLLLSLEDDGSYEAFL